MNPLALIAIGLGAVLLYSHFGKQSGSTTLPSGNTGAGGSNTTSPAGPSLTTSNPTNATQAPPSPQTLPVAQATPLAAAGDTAWAQVLTERGVRHTVDEWNWYRVQGGAAAIAAEDMPLLVSDANRADSITANEYLERLEALKVTWHTL